MYAKKKDKLLINVFSDISDIYNYINKTPRRETAERQSEEGGIGFTGTHSLDEAYNLLLGGDERLYAEYKGLDKVSIEKVLGNIINKPKQINDIVGFQANVPQYLLGIPTNMINSEPKKTSQKILNIIINLTVSCGVSKEKIKKVGNLYLQVLDLLEKAGYRVNLYIMQAEESCGYHYYSMVRIKTDREPLNIKKCIFPIMHPSMHRRIFFKWEEVCDTQHEITDYGYGTPYTNKIEILKTLNNELKTNFIVWNFQRWDSNNSINVEAKNILDELKTEYGIDVLGKEV